MISRRNLITSTSAASLATLGLRLDIAARQTPVAETGAIPDIQGPGVDAGRTRVVEGSGIVHQPGEMTVLAEDHMFHRVITGYPQVMSSAGFMFATGAKDDFRYGFAVDPATGEELWKLENVYSCVGAADGAVFYTGRAPDAQDAATDLLKAVNLDTGEERWSVPMAGLPCGVFVNNETLLYGRNQDTIPHLGSINILTGDQIWEVDVSDKLVWSSIVPTVGDGVMVVPNDSKSTYTSLTAWNVEDGEFLWQQDRDEFKSLPAIRGGVIWVYTPEGLESLDVHTGETLDVLDLTLAEEPVVFDDGVLAVTDDAVVFTNKAELHCFSLSGAFENWSRMRIGELVTGQPLIANGMLFDLEEGEGLFDPVGVHGYDLATGEPTMTWSHPNEDLSISGFTIGNDRLYVSTLQGFCTVLPSDQPL